MNFLTVTFQTTTRQKLKPICAFQRLHILTEIKDITACLKNKIFEDLPPMLHMKII